MHVSLTCYSRPQTSRFITLCILLTGREHIPAFTSSLTSILATNKVFPFFFVYTTTHCSLKAYCAILVRRSNFRHQARAPSGGRWNCGREMSGNFALNADLHVTFRDLLHAVKLRHGTDGFISPPKEGVPRIFPP